MIRNIYILLLLSTIGWGQVSLEIQNVSIDSTYGTLDIYMINEVEVAGLQFTLSGVTPTDVIAGEIIPNDQWVVEVGGIILIADILTGEFIPPGEGVLVTVTFIDYAGEEICIVDDETFVISDPDAEEIFGSLGDCYTPPECDVALGDVNGDGDINIFDLVQIAYYILDLSIPDYECAADYNQDGSVDILDLVAIVNIILNP